MLLYILTAYLTASLVYTYMLVEKQEGKERYETLKEEHGDDWWKYYLSTAPVVFGKAVVKKSKDLDVASKAKTSISNGVEKVKAKLK